MHSQEVFHSNKPPHSFEILMYRIQTVTLNFRTFYILYRFFIQVYISFYIRSQKDLIFLSSVYATPYTVYLFLLLQLSLHIALVNSNFAIICKYQVSRLGVKYLHITKFLNVGHMSYLWICVQVTNSQNIFIYVADVCVSLATLIHVIITITYNVRQIGYRVSWPAINPWN
jgi:hypothetical protein